MGKAVGQLSQALLKGRLRYCQDTGKFTWLVEGGYRNPRRGKEAGHRMLNGYITIRVLNKQYLAHRLAFLYVLGRFPADQVDHLNGVRDDNRFCNLREVDRLGNAKNVGRSPRNTSGVNGVSWCKRTGKWMVTITHNRKQMFLGRYKALREAEAVRKRADKEFGFSKNHGNPRKREDDECALHSKDGKS